MQTVGVKELKNRLSQMLGAVKGGEELLITDRGRPIARIVPEGATVSEAARLAALAARGILRLPEEEPGSEPDLEEVRGGPVADTVLAARR